jgi:hypothetical protein
MPLCDRSLHAPGHMSGGVWPKLRSRNPVAHHSKGAAWTQQDATSIQAAAQHTHTTQPVQRCNCTSLVWRPEPSNKDRHAGVSHTRMTVPISMGSNYTCRCPIQEPLHICEICMIIDLMYGECTPPPTARWTILNAGTASECNDPPHSLPIATYSPDPSPASNEPHWPITRNVSPGPLHTPEIEPYLASLGVSAPLTGPQLGRCAIVTHTARRYCKTTNSSPRIIQK